MKFIVQMTTFKKMTSDVKRDERVSETVPNWRQGDFCANKNKGVYCIAVGVFFD